MAFDDVPLDPVPEKKKRVKKISICLIGQRIHDAALLEPRDYIATNEDLPEIFYDSPTTADQTDPERTSHEEPPGPVGQSS